MVPTLADSSTPPNGIEAGSAPTSSINRAVVPSGATSPPPAQIETLPLSITDFDAMIDGEVKTFVNISEEVGGLVAEQVCVTMIDSNCA